MGPGDGTLKGCGAPGWAPLGGGVLGGAWGGPKRGRPAEKRAFLRSSREATDHEFTAFARGQSLQSMRSESTAAFGSCDFFLLQIKSN